MNKIQPYQQTEKENNNDYNWHGELIKRSKIMFSNHSFNLFWKRENFAETSLRAWETFKVWEKWQVF